MNVTKLFYAYFSLFAGFRWPGIFIVHVAILICFIAFAAVLKIKQHNAFAIVFLCLACVFIVSHIPQFIDLPRTYSKSQIDITSILKSEVVWNENIFDKFIVGDEVPTFESKEIGVLSGALGYVMKQEGLIRSAKTSKNQTDIYAELYLYDSVDSAVTAIEWIAHMGRDRKVQSSNLVELNDDAVNKYLITMEEVIWDMSDVGRYMTTRDSYAFIQKDRMVIILNKRMGSSYGTTNRAIERLAAVVAD